MKKGDSNVSGEWRYTVAPGGFRLRTVRLVADVKLLILPRLISKREARREMTRGGTTLKLRNSNSASLAAPLTVSVVYIFRTILGLIPVGLFCNF